jgi:hypothetical protein
VPLRPGTGEQLCLGKGVSLCYFFFVHAVTYITLGIPAARPGLMMSQSVVRIAARLYPPSPASALSDLRQAA